MKYCTHCGKELLDEAVICTGCDCPVEENLQPSSNPATKAVKKFTLKRIVLIVVATVVLIGAIVGVIVGVIVSKNNVRKQELCDALEGNRYSYTDYTLYTLTSLTFKENNQCEWYKFYSYTDNELEFTHDYSLKLNGDDAYVVVGGDTYKVEINSFGKIIALVDEETGDRYD